MYNNLFSIPQIIKFLSLKVKSVHISIDKNAGQSRKEIMSANKAVPVKISTTDRVMQGQSHPVATYKVTS